MNEVLLAHSQSKSGRIDTVADHLRSVAARAAEYASAFGAADEARLAGMVHDLGKYGSLFQQRLEGRAEHVDHWSAGAWHALTFQAKGLAAALAVQGHHIGLQWAEKADLAKLNPAKWDPKMHEQRRLSETSVDALLQRFDADGLTAVATASSLYDHADKRVSAMLDVRMLFSTLVDADFIETEAHFNAIGNEKLYRAPGPVLEPVKALELLLSHAGKLAQGPNVAADVKSLRSDLLRACLQAAPGPQDLFTLTAPTGAGKTLSMLAFALMHAAKHNLRRIVMVIPYLSIIEQTAQVYRGIFESSFGSGYVLEHHSLAGTRGKDDSEDVSQDRQRELSENWDAPIVVTTSVQFLESLFANRPSTCRKLHRLAQSVVLFDEVQTLPTGLVIPTLAALSRLSERYRATVVFATATQPAFSHLHEKVKQNCECGWQPREIVPAEFKLFDHARRTRIEWPNPGTPTPWLELADRLADAGNGQALCVVNLKRHALLLFQKLRELGVPDMELFHLSTSMCPEHRQAVLAEVRRLLAVGKPCRLISTQCVEAGVDVDFPAVFRAWGPLDSIAQAAGRCNRNGRAKLGTVHLFIPERDAGRMYPDGAYQQAADVAGIQLAARGSDGLDIHDPDVFDEYYRTLYSVRGVGENDDDPLITAIKTRHFAAVAEMFRLIPDATINVLVPYDETAYKELADMVRHDRITREWILRARPHTIGVYRPQRDAPILRWLEAVMSDRKRAVEGWFIYLRPKHYDRKVGLVPPEDMECLIS